MKKNILWVQYALGLIFLGAAVYRIFNFSAGQQELISLGFPTFLIFPLIIVEIAVAVSFLSNKYTNISIPFSIISLALIILYVLIRNFASIISRISELFILNATPTDLLLHLMYIVLLLIVFIANKKRSVK